MSDSASKVVSERDAVLREREAFKCGTRYSMAGREEVARIFYPLSNVTRPRVVSSFGVNTGDMLYFRVYAGQLQVSNDKLTWQCAERPSEVDICGYGLAITPDRVRLWADLYTNPTENVEDAL